MYIKSFSVVQVVQTPFRSYLSLSWRGLRMYHLTDFCLVRSGTQWYISVPDQRAGTPGPGQFRAPRASTRVSAVRCCDNDLNGPVAVLMEDSSRPEPVGRCVVSSMVFQGPSWPL